MLGLDLNRWTAADLFEALKGPTPPDGFGPAPHCQRIAPPAPNMYTDGRAALPNSQFALSGFGVWIPPSDGVDCGTRPIPAQDTLDVAHSETSAGGTFLWCRVAGPIQGSCRAELTATLLALSCAGPLHICTDSSYVVKGWRRITSKRHLKPWTHVPNGDLWQAFHAKLVERGPHSVRLSHIWSHMTREQACIACVSEHDRLGNALADEAAARGLGQWGDALHVANAYLSRYKGLGRLAVAIRALMLDVLLSSSARRAVSDAIFERRLRAQ